MVYNNYINKIMSDNDIIYYCNLLIKFDIWLLFYVQNWNWASIYYIFEYDSDTILIMATPCLICPINVSLMRR